MGLFEWLSHMDPVVGIMLAIFVPMGIIGLVATIGGIWAGSRKTELEASLKLEMISRGMSAEDIERVLNATLGGTPAKCSADKPAVNVAAEYKAQPVRT